MASSCCLLQGTTRETKWRCLGFLGNVTNSPINMGGIPVFLFLHQNLGIGQPLTAETNLQLSYNIVSVCMYIYIMSMESPRGGPAPQKARKFAVFHRGLTPLIPFRNPFLDKI